MSIRSTIRRTIICSVSAIAVLGVPATASAMTTATIDVSEGCCGGPWDSDGTFIRYTAELENTGAETMNIDTLRVTFDPRDLEWNDGADTNPSDSVFDSYTDGGAFGPNEEPISDDPTL